MLIKSTAIICILFLSANVFAGEEFSVFYDNACGSTTSSSLSWTSWFNSQDPKRNSGNDIEDLVHLRMLSKELNRCSTVSNVDYAVVEMSHNEFGSYRTLINHNGLFCVGTKEAPCPNYKVRFCCPSEGQTTTNQCGITTIQPYLNSPIRIVNGFEAMPHSFPWVVSLQYKGYHDCGGVILDQWNILTAAHCLDYENDLGNYTARVGVHRRYSSGEIMPIQKLILHPEYEESSSVNDIGIIRLARPITFSERVQPICLLEDITEPPLGTTVYITGWGNTIHQMWNSSSSALLQARLRVVSDCSMYFAFDRETQLCVAPNGPAGENHGSCQGDSGGGLLYLKNGRWYVAGVVSYATRCGEMAFPTVYTKTATYTDWIRQAMNYPV